MYYGQLNEKELSHLEKLVASYQKETGKTLTDNDSFAWCRDCDFILVNGASVGNSCEICGKSLYVIVEKEKVEQDKMNSETPNGRRPHGI
jgi:fructose-specific component phosphotransferase system IIB-like protein